MRVAFSGTANTGKSTLVRDFLSVWPMYKTPEVTYRDLIVEQKLAHSKAVGKEGQSKILELMTSQLEENKATENIVYDRCPIDNIIYSIWGNGKGIADLDDEFIRKCFNIVRESIKNLDIIFWVPFNRKIAIQQDFLRETDIEFIVEVDNIFKEIFAQYTYNPEFPISDQEDRPAFIQLTATSRQERIVEIAQYVDLTGSSVAPDDSWVNELVSDDKDTSEEAKATLEALLKQQKEEAFKVDGTIVV